MFRLRLTIAYVGTNFSGWQIQAPGLRTVQGCLEEAFSILCSGKKKEGVANMTPVRIIGAGRTDAGVHALAQAAHVDIPADRVKLPFVKACKGLLPDDISLIGAEIVDRDFHARFKASAKTYSYTLWHEPNFILPQRRPFIFPVGRLDLSAMQKAAELLIGQHDFAAFQNVGTLIKDTVREIFAIEMESLHNQQETIWRITGNGFLKQMVRNIVGCLVQVGRGKLSLEDVRYILISQNRKNAPATAPAAGLCLEEVKY